MTLRLYVDECVDARIIRALVRRGIDIVTVGEMGLLGESDETQLQQAIELDRIPVSCDHDFLSLAHAGIGTGGFVGLIFVKPSTDIGATIRSIERLATTLHPEDVAERILWVP